MDYKRIVIDLNQSRDDEEINFGTNYTSFLICKSDEDFEYRINSKTSDKLKSSEFQGFENVGVFSKIFMTNEKTDGEVVLVVYR